QPLEDPTRTARSSRYLRGSRAPVPCTGRSNHRRLAQCRTSCSARPHLSLPSPRPVGRRAPAHLRAQRPQPHRQSHHRFVTASSSVDNNTRTSWPHVFVVRWELTTFLRSGGAPRTAVHVVGPGGCPIGLRMQPRNENQLNTRGAAIINGAGLEGRTHPRRTRRP